MTLPAEPLALTGDQRVMTGRLAKPTLAGI